MDSAELRRRLERGEDLHTEFEEWPVNPDSAAAAIVAFANTDGGQLILGISDDHFIAGVPDPDRAAQWVDDVARNKCEPPVTVIQEVLKEPDGIVLSISVPKGDLRPYQTRSGLCYIRTSSGRRRASREELLRLFQASERMYYDETRLIGLSVDELDPVAVDRFAEATGRAGLGLERDQLLRAWRLVRDGHPTVAGVLLFGRDPQRHLPSSSMTEWR